MSHPMTQPGEALRECVHQDERGSTVIQATVDRYECAVCGQQFRLIALAETGADPDRKPGEP